CRLVAHDFQFIRSRYTYRLAGPCMHGPRGPHMCGPTGAACGAGTARRNSALAASIPARVTATPNASAAIIVGGESRRG
ncbi:MAG TPA: hypothetical protein VID48_07420, partial [Solirubrobacteraceae bacterium]